jgi:hypothetical protein
MGRNDGFLSRIASLKSKRERYQASRVGEFYNQNQWSYEHTYIQPVRPFLGLHYNRASSLSIQLQVQTPFLRCGITTSHEQDGLYRQIQLTPNIIRIKKPRILTIELPSPSRPLLVRQIKIRLQKKITSVVEWRLEREGKAVEPERCCLGWAWRLRFVPRRNLCAVGRISLLGYLR